MTTDQTAMMEVFVAAGQIVAQLQLEHGPINMLLTSEEARVFATQLWACADEIEDDRKAQEGR